MTAPRALAPPDDLDALAVFGSAPSTLTPARELYAFAPATSAARGTGWRGHRYDFSLAAGKLPGISGTVDVDDRDRVRRIELNLKGTRIVMEFSGYGTKVEVAAPSAEQVVTPAEPPAGAPGKRAG